MPGADGWARRTRYALLKRARIPMAQLGWERCDRRRGKLICAPRQAGGRVDTVNREPVVVSGEWVPEALREEVLRRNWQGIIVLAWEQQRTGRGPPPDRSRRGRGQ